MAFAALGMQQLSLLPPPDNLSRSLNKWEYVSTTDALATILAANYFDALGATLQVGDVIDVKATDGFRTIAVLTNTTQNAGGGHVTVNGNLTRRMIAGQAVTATAADTIATGLATVLACGATLDSDPVDDPEWTSATVGDQAGAPVAGSIIVKTWKNTAGNDPTPLAATTFAKKVNWWAYGY